MEIYAELFFDEEKNKFLKDIPSSVSIKRKGQSRLIIFEVNDDLDRQELIEILENNQVCYQDMD